MIEMGEKESAEAVADKEAAETAAHAALMKGANLEVTLSWKHVLHIFATGQQINCISRSSNRELINITGQLDRTWSYCGQSVMV